MQGKEAISIQLMKARIEDRSRDDVGGLEGGVIGRVGGEEREEIIKGQQEGGGDRSHQRFTRSRW